MRLAGRSNQQRNCLLIICRQVLAQSLRDVAATRHELQCVISFKSIPCESSCGEIAVNCTHHFRDNFGNVAAKLILEWFSQVGFLVLQWVLRVSRSYLSTGPTYRSNLSEQVQQDQIGHHL